LKRDLRNIIKHNHSVQELSVDFFVKVTRSSLVHRSSYIRAAAIRLIRYVIGCVNISDTFWKYHCHYLLSPMFFVDKRQDKEKRQMIELMRQISTRMYDAEHVPLLLVKCLVSIAENPEDTYMASTTEILRDLLVKNPEVVSKASGTKALLHAVINPKFKDISESIVLSFLYLLDDAKMRRYVREGELQTIFGPLTQESYAED
ncbi:rapamycin-insensitive companion of mTOR piaA, partial [Acrasis kona]